jgi:hypothetical protein
LRRGRWGLSELLSALILLSISIAVAFIMVYYLPVISPPSVKPWLRPTLIAAFKNSNTVTIYLYNPHSDSIKVVEAWIGSERPPLTCSDGGCIIEPRNYETVTISVSGSVSSVLLRFDTGAWMEVIFS